MPVIGLDTNILVRYITGDDEQQWRLATTLIESTEQCFVSHIVLCELVWVLRGEPYNYSKVEILRTLDTMLQTAIFEFENRSVIYQAVQRTRQGKGDFSDYLLGALARQLGCQATATFDRKLRGENGFQFLSEA